MGGVLRVVVDLVRVELNQAASRGDIRGGCTDGGGSQIALSASDALGGGGTAILDTAPTGFVGLIGQRAEDGSFTLSPMIAPSHYPGVCPGY